MRLWIDSRSSGAAAPPLGPAFGWLWAAFAVSTIGTWLAFDAFALIAVLVLDAGPAAVSGLAAAGLAVAAVVAVPLGPWVERRPKRRVMVAMDLLRFAALATVPLAVALGRLTMVQLVAVAVVVGASDIAFRAASGACLKALVPAPQLVRATGRLEATSWTATMVGPPLGGAAIALLGPAATILANAVSHLLSAAALRAIPGGEPAPPTTAASGATGRPRPAELVEGWRFLLRRPPLRALLLNTVLVNGLILAVQPLVAVLMLGRLGFAPWQYALAFGAPCVGGLVGSRLAPWLVARWGTATVLRRTGTWRAFWSVGLAAVVPGPGGLLLVLAVQLGLVTCAGLFSSVLAAHRLAAVDDGRVARVLAAWSTTSNATVAVLTALWGLLAGLVGLRAAIAAAGLLLWLTPLLLRGTDEFRRRPRSWSAKRFRTTRPL
ncbi:MFS transporter [Patulibacter defluvii]|uniref:MFS transporter n=1 Tax=Patulibacter defluvii TaxID=3095358 RepID=UPI002A752CA1|nr:MFS transporter [Patulibacter sp. DM4]